MKKHSGSCLCGSVKFSFEGPLDDIWFCHCSQCRKNYGMYGAFVGVLHDSLKINKSKYLNSYRASKDVKRTFCSKCGSPILWDKKGLKYVYILLGLLDEKVNIKKANHIHTKNKGGYYKICDKWPQYKTVPK